MWYQVPVTSMLRNIHDFRTRKKGAFGAWDGTEEAKKSVLGFLLPSMIRTQGSDVTLPSSNRRFPPYLTAYLTHF